MDTGPLLSRIATALLAAMVGTSCAIHPSLLAEEDFRARMVYDLERITAGNEPVDGPVSIYEAMARALRYNLDLQLELRKKALAARELELSRWEMLPRLVADLGWNDRDEYQAASSISYLTGQESLEPSYSQEREIFTSSLGLTWNVLDFGLSYVRAKQNADRVLAAEEQKRKVAHRIAQDVTAAFWRAVSAERLLSSAEALEAKVGRALANSREAGERRLTSPLTALTYERELLSIRRELQRLQRELSFARLQLAALMNVRPGENFRLLLPSEHPDASRLGMPLEVMEETAFLKRPEIRELAYEERININQAKAAILQLLPTLEIQVGREYNSNDLLVNNDWITYGARVSYGLIKAFALPRTLAKIEAEEEVLRAQRLALSMAVLTQVHVSKALLDNRVEEYETAASYRNTQELILEQVRASVEANSVGEQAVIREEMNTLVAHAKHDIAFAEVETAYAGALVAMGVDLLPRMQQEESLREFAAAIAGHQIGP
jgi:outer membrane protein TolC